MNIFFVANDVHPPWSNACKSLTYNLVKALSTVRCSDPLELYLITHCYRHSWAGHEVEYTNFLTNFKQSIVLDYLGSINTASSGLYNVFRKSLKILKLNDAMAHLIDINPLLFGLPSKFQLGRPIVHQIYLPYFEESSLTRLIYGIGGLLTYNLLINKIITTSPLTKEYIDRLTIKSCKTALLYPPVDTNHYRPLNKMERKTDLGTEYTLLFMGALHPGRFPTKLILNAIRKVRTDHNIDVGLQVIVRRWPHTESYIEEIHRYACKLGIKRAVKVEVKLLSENEKLFVYNESTALLQLLGGFYAADPPITMLEAMACGVPPITTYEQSITYIVDHQVNGVLVENSDPQTLSEAISVAISENRKLGLNARRTIEKKMSYEVIAPKLLGIYKELT